jgi:hypothetical protein
VFVPWATLLSMKEVDVKYRTRYACQTSIILQQFNRG